MNKQIKYTVWDLETSGFVAPASKVLEIGAVIHYNDGSTEVFQRILNNEVEISEDVIKIHGLSKEVCEAEGVTPEFALLKIIEILKASPVNVTHNGLKFDIPFLINSCRHLPDIDWDDTLKYIKDTAYDTAVYFKAKKINCKQKDAESFTDYAERVMSIKSFGTKYNLALCALEEGVETSDVTLHRALGDVDITNKLYQIICKKNQMSLEN